MNLDNVNFADLGNSLMTNARSEGTVAIIITVICGLLTVFFGYKLLKLWITLAGFFIGLILGGGVAGLLKAPTAVIVIAAIVVAVLLAAAAFFFYKVGVFIFSGLMGFTLVTNLILELYTGDSRWWVITIGIVAAVLVGIVAVKFVRPVVIVTSSISGASSIAFTLIPLMGITNFWIILAAGLVIAALGMIWQFKSTEE